MTTNPYPNASVEVWQIVGERVQSGLVEMGRWHRSVSASFYWAKLTAIHQERHS